MTIDDVVQITSRALYVICITSAPVLLVSLIVGLIISIFQTVTSIQEQTLTFVPKLLSIFAVIVLCGNWIVGNVVDFMTNLIMNFGNFIQ